MFQRTRCSLFFFSPSSLFRPSSLLLIQFGAVRKWDDGSSFGFIRDDGSNSSIFVHRSNCVWQNPSGGNQSILVGTRVGYDLTLDEKKNDGTLRCENVTLEDGSPLPNGPRTDRAAAGGDNGRVSPYENDRALLELVGKTDVEGKIKSFNRTFGFIEFPDPREETRVLSIFALRQSIIQGQDRETDVRLRPGDQVVFDVCEDTKKPTTAQAKNISKDTSRNRDRNDSALLELIGKTDLEGKIKFFNNTFGFIEFPDPHGEMRALSIFAHLDDVIQEEGQENVQHLEKGDRVIFDVSNDANKRNAARATNISKKKHLDEAGVKHGVTRSDNDRALLELAGKTDMEGKIKSFSKTYGFIEFPDPRDKSKSLSIFAHLDDIIQEKGIEDGQRLQPGDEVVFDVSNDNTKPGTARATNISKKSILGDGNKNDKVIKNQEFSFDGDEPEY